MPRGYPSLTSEQRQEIMTRIKEKGEAVADLAKEYGVRSRIIYDMLSKEAKGGDGNLLEFSRLKREHEALLKIVGELIVDQKLGKKIKHRYGNK